MCNIKTRFGESRGEKIIMINEAHHQIEKHPEPLILPEGEYSIKMENAKGDCSYFDARIRSLK